MTSKLPNSSKLFSNIQRDTDERGGILSIVDTNIQNVSIIECNPKSIRSNHYHLSDWHYMFVLSGRINYFFSQFSIIINFTVKNNNIFFILIS